MATYDLKYPGAAIDAILDTAYDLQNAGYIFRGLASEYSNTPTERSWVLAGEGETGHGFTSAIPKGYIGVCVFDGTSWTGKLLKCVSIDSTPTNGSTNALSSGGAYTSISQLATTVNEALDNLTFTDTTPSAFLGEYITEKVSTTDGGIERILTYFTILAATTSKAGLLSAADKAKLDAILTNLRSLEIDDTTAYADLGDKIVESIKATIGGTEETISTFQILAATASKAGLLSAADKAKLDALWSSGYQFAGIATPSTTPISTTSKIFYIATEAGTYFNAVTVTQGINLLSWNGTAWSAVQVVGIDDEPTAGSNSLVKSGSIKRYGVDIDGEMNLAFGVIQGQALNQTFDVSGLEIKDGDRLNFTLSTNLIDSSGINILLNSTSFILRNDSTLTKDIEENLETITVVRTGTDGIIGTGTVTLQVSKDGCINARLQELEEGYANDTLTIKKQGIDIDGYFSPNFNVEEDVGINYTFDVSDLGVKAGDTVVFGLDTLLIDSSGINLYLNESHYVLRNGTSIRINLDSALETIRVNRAGTGIVGTGVVILSAKKEGSIEDEISALNNGFVTGKLDIKNLAVAFEDGYYYSSSGELVENNNSIYTIGIDISQYAGLNISVKGTFSLGKSRYCLITTDEGEILKKAREYDCRDAGVMDFGLIPASAKYLKLSFASSTNIDDVTIYASLDKESSNVVYVDAVNGSDTNSGGTGDPFASFAKALEATGDDTTIILRGDINEGINIKTKSNQKSLTVIGEKGRKNRILLGTFITDATQYSGNVYSVTLDSFPSREKYPIFQHEVPDANTLITDEERHPLQRGREYRCESTLLLPVSSVEDVVASEAQTYYWDSDNDTLYFKIAEGTDLATNPIVLPNGSSIYGNDGTVQVRIINIDSWYCNFNLTLSHGAVCENCSAKFALAAGGFRWDNAIGVKLYQCEAARIFAGNETNGDGFNAHSTVSEDAMARHTTCMMMDCWSHDNNDDGYSDHERCECSIHGGLFEYNGKGGLTPSYGSHLVCYDVLSRKNYRGFYYIHAAAETEGGKYGQMICYNCVAENNTIDGGFRVNGAGNKAILVNCKSIGNPIGYMADTGTIMEIIDCGTLDNNIDKQASGTGEFVFKNTNILNQ